MEHIKVVFASRLCALFILLSIAPFLVKATSLADPPPKMNIIFILADDLGWSDCTLFGTTQLYRTPNLERLAQRGITFTNAYAASPLCSPTRASILTGQTPARTGITEPNCHYPEVVLNAGMRASGPAGDKALLPFSATRLNTNLPTLSKLIKADGYATAHFGKWHLGLEPYSPLEHGFDVDIPHWSGPGPAGSFVAPWQFPNFTENYGQEHIEDRMAEEAIKWMSLKKDQPFYLNYWQFSVHAPFNAKKGYVDDYRTVIDTNKAQRSSRYAAMVQSMDDAIGKLLDAVDSLGIAERTAIIFISDNGGNMYDKLTEKDRDGNAYICPATDNTPLRGGKATIFDGGIRVPCVVVWPGVTQTNKRSDDVIQTTDFYPTILTRLGISLPNNYKIDGYDITTALLGGAFKRKPMFTYFPFSPKIVPDWLPGSVAVRDGDWKLIRLFYECENGSHGYFLFNLKNDIGERNNLAAQYPEKVREMDKLIEDYLRDSNAVIPIPNPGFNPALYHPELIGIPIN